MKKLFLSVLFFTLFSSVLTSTTSNAATTPPYRRAEWRHWIDLDGDCQNTRAELLIAESLSQVRFKSEQKCRVIAGSWIGPYTARRYFKASQLHIDHVVPLKLAHVYGGSAWSRTQKQVFANDRLNLVAAQARANRSKGSKGPSSWMPENRLHWCEYAETWDEILRKYSLQPSRADQAKIDKVLQGC